MNPEEFIEKWRGAELKESGAYQEHFVDLCRLLEVPTPANQERAKKQGNAEDKNRKPENAKVPGRTVQ
jgi:hypothetical protein